MINGINLTNLYTWLDIFSLPPVALIFPLQLWNHHERTHNIILNCWTHFIMLLKCYINWCYTARATNYNHYVFISKFTLLNIIYFIITIPLDLCYYATGMLSTHWRYTARTTNHIKISCYISIFKFVLWSTCYLIISVPLIASYSNNILLFNKHVFTNISLMNIKILTSWTHPIAGHTLFGHKPLMDIYIIWTLTTTGHILFGHKPLLDIYYMDMNHSWIWTILDSPHYWTYDI